MTKEDVKQIIIDAQTELIKELSKELRRLQLKNLKMKMHMQVLVSHPGIKASREIRKKYSPESEVSKELLTGSMN